MKLAALVVLATLLIAFPIFSQALSTGARPQFDVASIKVHPPPLTRIIVQAPPGRWVAEAFSLKMLVGRAFGVPDVRVLGGPGWIESERYDIEAKTAEGQIPEGQLNLMIQSLLEDRFQLKAHKETRELPMYELVVARGGSKMKLSEDQTPPAPPTPGGAPPRGAGPGRGTGPASGPFGGPPPRGAFFVGRGDVQGTAIAVSAFASFLVNQLGRPVTDKTGLTGLFDFKLQWTPGPEQIPGPFTPLGPGDAPPEDASRPSLFSALQEQLGLRLESTKGPVEVVVVDSAQKPAEN